ncbi:hypothetical protein PICST_28394 [Scheffersomyces stipitis CBS 6054]|uniref:FHA domain-containing protein n=1 Tax=Scheffersomyces stipitis (strain ATCC 58785 / CBS 6054 / NBRC 10063 / NRRL Y-11545) TaxID=322104 RepID=A3GFX2_PICST|nr:hypothetical protein PICST_28394 [Scheffersomyces stipitis CBS 6054]EAZ63835.2 hypothetical protein PICST_28394 [Scheffersomyces stipitis CBS 6054]
MLLSNDRVIPLAPGSEVLVRRASERNEDRTPQLNNLFFKNSHLSKTHAAIKNIDGSFYIKDLGSTFGSVLNNNFIVKDAFFRLSNGDKVGFVISKPSATISSVLKKYKTKKLIPLTEFSSPTVALNFEVRISGTVIRFIPDKEEKAEKEENEDEKEEVTKTETTTTTETTIPSSAKSSSISISASATPGAVERRDDDVAEDANASKDLEEDDEDDEDYDEDDLYYSHCCPGSSGVIQRYDPPEDSFSKTQEFDLSDEEEINAYDSLLGEINSRRKFDSDEEDEEEEDVDSDEDAEEEDSLIIEISEDRLSSSEISEDEEEVQEDEEEGEEEEEEEEDNGEDQDEDNEDAEDDEMVYVCDCSDLFSDNYNSDGDVFLGKQIYIDEDDDDSEVDGGFFEDNTTEYCSSDVEGESANDIPAKKSKTRGCIGCVPPSFQNRYPCGDFACGISRKRTFEEMSTPEFEDEEDDVADETKPAKKAKPSSTFKTIVKEVAKASLYVLATMTALGIYGSTIAEPE